MSIYENNNTLTVTICKLSVVLIFKHLLQSHTFKHVLTKFVN